MKKIKRQFKQISKTALLSLVFSLTAIVFSMGLKVVLAAWQPAGSSPPQDNAYTPLDVSAGHQVKKGFLLIDPNYNPYGEIPTVNYPLEVKGAGASISSHLTVDSNFEVDDTTLYVDIANDRVGIGTRTPASTLNIEEGGLKIDSSVASVNALEGYSSGSHGVYGVATAANKAGVYGWRVPTGAGDGAGVLGEGSIGVYGVSGSGTGVYAETNSGTNGAVYALNYNPLGWAGYFVGRLYATSEIAGNKFLPTSLQNSLIPYTSGWKIGDFQTAPDANANPVNLVFDGTYIWVVNQGITGSNYNVSQLRASDGMRIRYKNLPISFLDISLDITFDGQYIWVSTSDGSLHIFLASSQEGYQAILHRDKAENIIATFDGTNKYIWYASSTANKVGRVNGIGVSGAECNYSAGLSNPQGLAFDGTNVWVANYGGNKLYKIKFSDCSQIGSYDIASPHRIIFDGTNLWVTRKTAESTNNLVKVNLSGQTINYSTGINNPYDLAFDGTYIWVTHEGSTKMVRMRASDAGDKKEYEIGADARGIIFDGTYLWIGRSSGNTITKLYSGTGWGYPDLTAYLTLQGSTVVAQTGSIHMAGTARLGGNMSVAGDLLAPKNTWDGTADTIRFFGESCPNGQFAKGVNYSPLKTWRTPEEVSYTDKASNGEYSKDRESVYEGPSMAVDGNGYPHITWVNRGDKKVCSDGSANRRWTCNIDTDCSNHVQGNLGVCIRAFEIYYLKWNGSQWVTASGVPREQALLDPINSNLNVSNIPNVSPDGGASDSHSPSLTLDNNGNAHITFYQGYPTYTLYFLRWDPNYNKFCSNDPTKACEDSTDCGGSSCDTVTPAKGAWVTMSGKPRDIAISNTSKCPRTSYRDAGEMCNLIVDVSGEYPSLAMDRNNNPHLTYTKSFEIYYRWWDPSNKVCSNNPQTSCTGSAGDCGGRSCSNWVDANPTNGVDDINVSNTYLPGPPGDWHQDSVYPRLVLDEETPQGPHIVWQERRYACSDDRINKFCASDSDCTLPDTCVKDTYGRIYYRWWNPAASPPNGAWVTVSGDLSPSLTNIWINYNVYPAYSAYGILENFHGDTPDLALAADAAVLSGYRPGIVWRDPCHVLYRQWSSSANDWQDVNGGNDWMDTSVDHNPGVGQDLYNYCSLPSRPEVEMYNNTPYVAWSSRIGNQTPAGNIEINFRRWDGSKWVTISGDSGAVPAVNDLNLRVSQTSIEKSLSPSLTVNASTGVVHVAWLEKSFENPSCVDPANPTCWCTNDSNCTNPAYSQCALYGNVSGDKNKCTQFDVFYNRSGTNQLMCRPL